jgi:nucleoside-diphosphate-sugar epimerase
VTRGAPVVAITGATGYLGSVLVRAFESAGYDVRRLVRSPVAGTTDCSYQLGVPPPEEALEGADLLLHCAYDLGLTKRTAIWESNVFGTISLFDQALASGVTRTITLSSMSAYAGTRQLYGRAKLAIELAARARGICVVRPGLVYGPRWGGMAGTLRKLAALPVIPDFGPGARQFTVAEADLAAALVALAGAERLPPFPVGIANPDPVPFAELLTAFAASAGRGRPRFVPVPPMAVYTALRVAELLPVPLPVRADSLLGLIRPAPSVPHLEVLDQLGIVLRPFSLDDMDAEEEGPSAGRSPAAAG